MLNLESLEEQAKSKPHVTVSARWILALIKDIRADRSRIASLEADNVKLRAELARLRAGATTTKIIRDGVEVTDTPFPEKEFDEAMGFMDKAFASMDSMFAKIGRRK